MTYWNPKFDLTDIGSMKWELDTHKIIRDVTDQMYGAEETAFTEAVVEILRAKGYTVVIPGRDDS